MVNTKIAQVTGHEQDVLLDLVHKDYPFFSVSRLLQSLSSLSLDDRIWLVVFLDLANQINSVFLTVTRRTTLNHITVDAAAVFY